MHKRMSAQKILNEKLMLEFLTLITYKHLSDIKLKIN